MNERAVRFVVDQSPCEGATYLTHLALALHADDDATVRVAQPELARTARLHLRTLRGCVKTMIEQGLVEVVEQPVQWRPALLRLVGVPQAAPTARSNGRKQPGRRARSTGSTARSNQDALLALDQDQVQDQVQPNADALGDGDAPSAVVVVQRAWNRCEPKPAQPFGAMIKTAQALLDRGWPATDIEDAMVAVPTVTIGWCESELNRKRPNRIAPAQSIDRDRDAPGGRVSL